MNHPHGSGLRLLSPVSCLLSGPEVITFGEAMLRLAPPHFQRLEQARSLDLEIGGAELNTAVGLARLGRPTAWVSRLPDSPLGRLIGNRVREAGVADHFVKYAADGRCGIYYLEFAAAPRAATVHYDRADSSVSRVSPGEFDWPTIFTGAKWFHVTGITPALSANAAVVVGEALRAATAAGLGTSFDLNYRAKLWPADRAAAVLGELLPLVRVLIAGEGDAATLFGVTGATFGEMAAKLADRFGCPFIAGSRRTADLAWRNSVGGVLWTGGRVIESKTYEVEIVDRLGTGDAFAAGLIDGLLAGDAGRAIEWAAACGAVKHTILGDLPWFTRAEVEEALAGRGLRVRR